MRLDSNTSSFKVVLLAVTLVVLTYPTTDAGGSQSTGACAKNSRNPVLAPTPGSWDQGAIGRQFVLFNGTTYIMWYTAFNQTLAIGLAFSEDGVSWSKYPLPVLAAGASGSWDSGGVEAPAVLWNGTGYEMYYTGANGTGFASDIGVAFSKDAIHWQRYANNPVLTRGPGKYDAFMAKFGDVIYDPPLFKMWYTAKPASTIVDNTLYTIAYATSTDGLHWTKYAGNPVVTPTTPGRGDFYIGAEYPHVIKIDGQYLMILLFTDGADTISYAQSLDGKNWNSTGESLISNTNNFQDWDDIPYYPSPILNGSNLMLWYSGMPFGSLVPPPSIGLASCVLVFIQTASTATVTVTKNSTIVLSTTLNTTIERPAAYFATSVIFGISTVLLAIVVLVGRIRHRPS